MNKCINCGNFTTNKKFCCRSCAVVYNNKHRKHSDKTKQKIGKSVSKSLLLKYNEERKNNKLDTKICSVCGKEFIIKRRKDGRLSKQSTCSDECKHLLKIKNGKLSYLKMLKNGTFHPWQSRNIISYSEQFWINVLNNNNIKFIKEYYLDKKYFLDFYIIKNNSFIDLEIDGKQHKYENRIIHDNIRDDYLKSKNIKVYRIDWNEINSSSGSLLMQQKINDFLNYYNNIE